MLHMANILLLEPDIRAGNIYAEALRSRKHMVTTCTTAQQAICEADSLRPDIVVLELQLIRHSGIEFLYEFRSYPDWQSVPAIIVSQVPPTEFAQSGHLLRWRLGVRAYHYKPQTSLRTLLNAIDIVLETAANETSADHTV